MIKTFKQCRQFNMAAASFNQRAGNPQTKLGYAIAKISNGQIKNIMNEYRKIYGKLYFDNLEKKQIDLALIDKVTGAVLTAPQGSERRYQYDKEGLMQIIQAEREFNDMIQEESEKYDLKEFAIEPFYVTDIPEDLLESEVEGFKGFVIE